MTFVPGEGPRPARGMIIGEAPGRTEVQLGRPFVVPSGTLLNQALVALAVDREKCYVTNVVKELPLDEHGKIRPPNEREKKLWTGRIVLEIKETSPLCILALGRTAQNFLAELNVATPVVFAWHPAYVLRRHGGLSVEWLEQIREWAERIK